MFNDAKIYDLDEIAGNRPLRDFLLAVKPIDSGFNSVHTANLLGTAHVSTTVEQMHDLVEKFRHTIRMSGGGKASFKSHSAFSLDDNPTPAPTPSSSNVKPKGEDNRPSFRGKSVEPPQCVCGEKH